MHLITYPRPPIQMRRDIFSPNCPTLNRAPLYPRLFPRLPRGTPDRPQFYLFENPMRVQYNIKLYQLDDHNISYHFPIMRQRWPIPTETITNLEDPPSSGNSPGDNSLIEAITVRERVREIVRGESPGKRKCSNIDGDMSCGRRGLMSFYRRGHMSCDKSARMQREQ